MGCDVDITIDSLKTAIQVSNPVPQVKGLTSILKMKMTSVSITNFCHFVNGWRYIGHFSLKSVNKLLNENTKIEVSKTHLNYLVQKKGLVLGLRLLNRQNSSLCMTTAKARI